MTAPGVIDNTPAMKAAECRYFLEHGWSEQEVAELVCVDPRKVGPLAYSVRTGPAYIPTPAEIRDGMDRYRPAHLPTFVKPTRSPAAIFEKAVDMSVVDQLRHFDIAAT